jgi:ribosome-associated protein
MNDSNLNHDDEEIIWVSKSEIKRDMHKLQEMGEKLLKIKASDLANFPLDDQMLAAIEESKRIKSNEAMRRHLQYIGKLMRSLDIDAIQTCLDKLDPSSDYYQRIQNQAEQWRLQMLQSSDAIANWIDTYPETDRQQLRAVVRAAQKEQPEDKTAPLTAGKNTKKLLSIIKETLLA